MPARPGTGGHALRVEDFDNLPKGAPNNDARAPPPVLVARKNATELKQTGKDSFLTWYRAKSFSTTCSFWRGE